MAELSVSNLSGAAHRALSVRAAERGRSIEEEACSILTAVVLPEERVKLGTLLAEVGKCARMSDEEIARFFQRDKTPTGPIDFG